MGIGTFSRDTYTQTVKNLTGDNDNKTTRGEEKVRNTGKLDILVDPASYGVIRESRIRLNPLDNGGFEVSIGAPSSIEYRLDTTGSMGNNVNRALKALPQICELTAEIIPNRDLFFCAGIFGDYTDRFILCRGQYEVLPERMVEQLTLMYPEGGGGGNGGEDPQYGLFGAAYLTNAYLHRLGLKSMDFTITDEPMHPRVVNEDLIRVFGAEVYAKCKENGYDISPNDIPSNEEIVKDMLKRTHGFALLVDTDRRSSLKSHWEKYYGKERVVRLIDIDHLPHVMAAIIGLTEGTLDLLSCSDFLQNSGNLSKSRADEITSTIAHIPLGAQCILPNYSKLPKQGDFFLNKTDLFPSPRPAESMKEEGSAVSTIEDDGGWL